MRYSAVVLTLIVALSSAAHAGNKYMYSFGGAGDAPDEVNMFTPEFNLIAVTAQGYGWKNHILFNGQHSKDIDEVKGQAGDNVKKFSQQNFAQSLKQIQKDLASGKIKAGDQVMFLIDTHGEPTSSGKAHQVWCSDGLCDLKALNPVLRSLEEKGVKTAVVDLSCYSGHSLDLASEKTCVISGASKNDTAWNTFSVGFTSALQPGHSLEEAYLQTRSNTPWGLPQISSPAGKRTLATIQGLSKESKTKLTVADFVHAEASTCMPLNFKQLLKTGQQFNDVQGNLTLLAYTRAVSDYQKIYQQAQDLARQINSLGGLHHIKDDLGVDYTWSNLASFKDDWLQERIPTGYELKQRLKKDSNFQKLIKLQQEFDQLVVSSQDGKGSLLSPLTQAALKVQEAERDLYDRIYRQNQKTEKGKNPCADFLI